MTPLLAMLLVLAGHGFPPAASEFSADRPASAGIRQPESKAQAHTSVDHPSLRSGLSHAQGASASAQADDEQVVPGVVMLDQVNGCYGAVRFDHRLHVGMSSIGEGCTTCHHDAVEGAKVQPCRACHDAASTVVTSDRPGLRGAYHRQCLGCHKEWSHQNACGFCHGAGNPGPSGADDAGPSLTRSHALHPLLASFQARSEAQSTYVYNTEHHALPVVTFHHADHAQRFGLKCADCHGGSSCGQCHGPDAARPVVRRQDTCYRCHSESRCVTCHNVAERGPFDHGARTGWLLRPAHASLECAACHEDRTMPAHPSSQPCRDCHARRWAGPDGAGAAFDHADTGVVLYGGHAYFECTDCHAGGNDQMVAGCTRCHEERPVMGRREVGKVAQTYEPGTQ